MFHTAAKLLLKLWFKIFYRVEVVGREHIPSSGGMIILHNALSPFKALVLETFLPRPLYWAIEPYLYQKKRKPFFLLAGKNFPLNPLESNTEAFRKAFSILKESRLLSFYPGKINAGLTLFSLRADAPILPVVVIQKEANPRQITLFYGNTYDFCQLSNAATNVEIIERTAQIIVDSLRQLLTPKESCRQ